MRLYQIVEFINEVNFKNTIAFWMTMCKNTLNKWSLFLYFALVVGTLSHNLLWWSSHVAWISSTSLSTSKIEIFVKNDKISLLLSIGLSFSWILCLIFSWRTTDIFVNGICDIKLAWDSIMNNSLLYLTFSRST